MIRQFFALAALVLSQGALAQSDYEIGPGDVLSIRVLGEDVGGEYVVGANGSYSFPFVGMVPVNGETTFSAEEQLREALAPDWYINPQITITISEHRSRKIEVSGAVEKAGTYYLKSDDTLRGVISQSGGIDKAKSSHRVVVRRGGEEVMVVAVDDLSGAGGDFRLAGGDVVTVDEGEVVFIDGEVKKPGAVSYYDGLTVTQALTRAGGPSGLARMSGAYVLRDGQKISVNIRRILKGKASDLVMLPGDQLFLKESVL